MRLRWPDRIRLHWRANLLMLRHLRAVIGFIIVGLAPALLWMAAAEAAARWMAGMAAGLPIRVFGDPRLDAYLLLAPGYLLAQHLAFMIAMRRWYTPFVRLALGRMGHPVCSRCGQSSLASSLRCPECGLQSP